MDYKQSLRDHYGFPDLVSAIAQALKAQGKTIETITRDDLRALDEFHIQGRKATQELARRAGLQKGMKVLDLGCGIGGPARTLAAEFGCHVTGIDIIEEYCEAATFLTHHLGLSDRVRFLCGDVSELSDAAASYDLVWSQHVLMNIADKRRLLSEVHRVLRPNGIFAFFEICSGANAPSHFPVPWAGDESVHFPVSSDDLRSMLEG